MLGDAEARRAGFIQLTDRSRVLFYMTSEDSLVDNAEEITPDTCGHHVLMVSYRPGMAVSTHLSSMQIIQTSFDQPFANHHYTVQ